MEKQDCLIKLKYLAEEIEFKRLKEPMFEVLKAKWEVWGKRKVI